MKKKGANEWRTIGPLLTGLETKAKLTFPQNIVVYFSNFEGLGLVNIRHDIFLVSPTGLYEELEKIYRTTCEAVPHDKDIYELTFERGKIEITQFGHLFITACLTKLK